MSHHLPCRQRLPVDRAIGTPSAVAVVVAAASAPVELPDMAGAGGAAAHPIRAHAAGNTPPGEPWEARTLGPYYGDLEAPGEFERMIRTAALHSREIIVLHGDAHRLRMLVNLIAELNALGIFHILLLGFNEPTCRQMAIRGRIGCAHSSYLWDEHADGEKGELARHRSRWTLAPRYVAWIQKFHYMRRLLEARVNVLALDSDVVVTGDPYPHLHGPFGRFQMVTAFDTKGGFANINVGIVYTQNATVGGPVHGLFAEFERRVALGLRTPPPRNEHRRESLAVRFFWDQNLFNKVLLSRLIDRDVYLPDSSDAAWTSSHMDALRLVGRPGPIEHAPGGVVWLSADVPVRTPASSPRAIRGTHPLPSTGRSCPRRTLRWRPRGCVRRAEGWQGSRQQAAAGRGGRRGGRRGPSCRQRAHLARSSVAHLSRQRPRASL